MGQAPSSEYHPAMIGLRAGIIHQTFFGKKLLSYQANPIQILNKNLLVWK